MGRSKYTSKRDHQQAHTGHTSRSRKKKAPDDSKGRVRTSPTHTHRSRPGETHTAGTQTLRVARTNTQTVQYRRGTLGHTIRKSVTRGDSLPARPPSRLPRERDPQPPERGDGPTTSGRARGEPQVGGPPGRAASQYGAPSQDPFRQPASLETQPQPTRRGRRRAAAAAAATPP